MYPKCIPMNLRSDHHLCQLGTVAQSALKLNDLRYIMCYFSRVNRPPGGFWSGQALSCLCGQLVSWMDQLIGLGWPWLGWYCCVSHAPVGWPARTLDRFPGEKTKACKFSWGLDLDLAHCHFLHINSKWFKDLNIR